MTKQGLVSFASSSKAKKRMITKAGPCGLNVMHRLAKMTPLCYNVVMPNGPFPKMMVTRVMDFQVGFVPGG